MLPEIFRANKFPNLNYYAYRLIVFIILFALLVLSSCRTAKAPEKLTLEQVKTQIEQSPVFAQNFTGFALYDLDANKMVIEHLANKYFTPASNAKIATFYAGLKILPDSLPALRYTIQHDSLIFWGTGDPTLLHPDSINNRTWHFLKNRPEKLFFSPANFAVEPFGPGWAYADYNYNYSAERSPLPVYGNFVRFTGKPGDTTTHISPSYFKQQVKTSGRTNSEGDIILRHPDQNRFTYYPKLVKKDFEEDTPFKQSPELLVKLLSDTLHRPVKLLHKRLPKTAKSLYSVPADSLYQRMMQESDNTFAEHLLLLCSATVFDSLNTDLIIDHITKTYLLDLPDKPAWVDGSGLSRFNLFTPRSIIALWQKIYQVVPRERLFSLLTIGGKTGTLRRIYKADIPFVFGKTGSLSNNLNQSGFLVTQSGKTYIFVFMNNNFVKPSAEIRQEMERIVTQIHQNF